MLETLRRWQALWKWLAISAIAHLAWEVAQLPLYMIWRQAGYGYVASAGAHCLAGDVLIAAATYLVAAAALRDAEWPRSKPLHGILMVVSFSVLYTAWSEWHNVYRVGSWAYSPAMPLLFGVGLSPLMQWIVVPFASLFALGRWCRAT